MMEKTKGAFLSQAVTSKTPPFYLIGAKTLRCYQWPKNLLLFIPLLTSHQFNLSNVVVLTYAWLIFSLCASAIYIANDLLDLPFDRLHPIKKNRVFASGLLSIKIGTLLVPLLLITSFSLASLISVNFLLCLIVYATLALAYSLLLKKYLFVDVIMLAILYTLRVVAGSMVINVPLSSWLLVYCLFVFLGLALLKRTAELVTSPPHTLARAYEKTDLPLLICLGTTASYISILIFCLYINDHSIKALYSHPSRLWLLCPLFAYWLSRMWLLAWRGKLNDDPVLFTLKDGVSYLIFGVTLGIVYWGV